MNHHLKTILFYLCLLLWSCGSESSAVPKSSTKEGDYFTTVIHTPAGEQLEGYNSSAIPTFFNVGQIGNEAKLETIVLGERIKKNKKVEVIPVAIFEFQRDSIHQKFLISLPDELRTESISKDFQTFMSYNNELTLAIENWFKLQCGLGHCRDLDWQFPHKRLMKLSMDNNLH